ncbi:hypothetical protein [Dietzia cinnamea]|uniref:hypothetical protein n=1 Tax=Dietzia cinnamea TaxID=321318 RepID=UPI00223B6541|nr:hypothetical protein [Dietzia cinnamea]MCT2077892.1 hypothetical protein [Dietzia cinnamea]MCT2221314.1 hypothetical protein [Dietzia cinnamea]
MDPSSPWLGFLYLVIFVLLFFVIPYVIGLRLRPWYVERWRNKEREKLKVQIGVQSVYNDLAGEAYEEYLREEEERRRREEERRRKQEEE